MWGQSCLSLAVEYVDLPLELFESELDVSCIVGEDFGLFVVPGSLAAGELSTDGWLLVSWNVEGGRSLMAAKYMRNYSMLGYAIKNGVGMGLQNVVGWGDGFE